jgi:hypothetical protein
VAVIEIELVPVAYGAVAHVIGSGLGGVVSTGRGSVRAEAELDKPVSFWLLDLSLALT